jgi:hypothetical protein
MDIFHPQWIFWIPLLGEKNNQKNWAILCTAHNTVWNRVFYLDHE